MTKETHYFYVLYCKDQTFYGGYTLDLKRRLDQHNQGLGAKYTRAKSRRPLSLIYAEAYSSRSQAMSAEYRFKQLSRQAKEAHLARQGVRWMSQPNFILVDKKEGDLSDEGAR